MTPVLFHFITPDGVPLANARVDIQLSRSSYDEDHDGVLMPRLVEATTDEDGKVTVELAPADALYYVECWDTDSEAGLSYKFMVPEQEVPNTPIRLQDIVIVGEMSSTHYDEAALIAIHAAKAAALTAAISATASAAAAATSATAADASADIAAAAVDVITGHMADATDVHAASAISNTPAGGISATTVQAAINELDTEKARLDGAAFTGAVSAPGFTGPLTGNVTGNVSGSAPAGSLAGTTLAANVVNASLSSITPAGGTLGITGDASASVVTASSRVVTDDINARTATRVSINNVSGTSIATFDHSTGLSSFNFGAAVTGVQTITANSASPALTVVNNGAGGGLAFNDTINTQKMRVYGDGSGTNDYGIGMDSTDMVAFVGAAGGFSVKANDYDGTTWARFTSGGLSLPTGTANGVAYLNGSKVLTTGSALTFDGSNVTVGTSAASYGVLINGVASGTNAGACAIVQNNGVPIIAIGNKSSLLGGAYSATPMLFALAPIEINQSIAVTGSISATTGVTTGATGSVALTIPNNTGIRSADISGTGAAFIDVANLTVRNPNAAFAPIFDTFAQGVAVTGYIAGVEQSAPSAPGANGYRIFAQDNGAGKTQLMVIFGSGAAQQIAIEP